MVSKMDDWHPLYGRIVPLELNVQHLGGTVLIYEKTQFHIRLRIIADYNIRIQGLSFSPTDSPPFLNACQASIPVVDPVLRFTSLCLVLLNLLNCIHTSCFLNSLFKVAVLKRCLKGLTEKPQMKHKNKQIRGERMGEGTDGVDGTKTTRISLSFPISTGLSGFSAQKHCPIIHPASSSIAFDRDASNSAAWKEETLREKTLSKGSKSDYLSCSSSSTLPIDLTAPVSTNCKPTMSFSVASGGPHFPASALHTSAKMDYSRDTSGVGLPNDYPEHSTTETAHILFNLSARAYQGQMTKDLESVKGKKRKGNSLHVELSLPLPSINPSSTSSSPPPLSPPSVSPLTLPPPSFHDSHQAVPKPELLCGVCHRLFSTASSLTVHMRLHRGGRLLSCRHCGKAFIHNKRLQSHEATCRQALPAFAIQPKQEPLEEGNVEKTNEATEPKQLEQETGPGRPMKKGRGLQGHHSRAIAHSDGLSDEDHFVKIVDGHIIYFCSVCERSYMTLSSLKRHSNVHSWRRKYPCHYCDKVFALAEYRTKHEVWHTGERRYQCIFCWEAFPTYYNLKTHQKAFHGISPGLISSEKTANGGYKQKVNALKLYRLLPMRSQKRPYKTYNQALADGLLKPDPSATLPLSLGCSLPPNLGTNKLDSFLKDFQSQDIKPDPESLLVKMDTEQCRKLGAIQAEVPDEVSEKERSDLHHSGNSSVKAKNVRCSDTAVSSVITFGHSKPSVIMHSTALPSSVIVQRNKTTSADGKCPSDSSHDKIFQKTPKKHTHKDHTISHSKWDTTSTHRELSKIQQPAEKMHKGRKAHNKSESSKVVPISVGSEVKGSGPLCQITVRIGEEAIVKRSISETDLMRDKSPPSKDKKSNFVHGDQREPRHTHHHHRKHHGHRSSSQEKRDSKLPGKVRKYYFRQEVREDKNDHDGEDNLWRPYYSYKPKRKTLHMQKIKSWQRKMHYKRSLRLMKRAEKLMSDVNKEGDALEKEEKGGVNKEEKEVFQQKEIKDNTQAPCIPTITEEKEEEKGGPGKCDTTSLSTASSQTTLNSQFPVSPTIKQRWSGDQASECGSCGRWFSSSRKRDKHELTHLFEFACLLCRATFPSQTKLEEHQRTSHPKNKPLSTSALCNLESSCKENSMEVEETSNVLNMHFLETKGAARLGRRPLTKYTCSQCDKVCKTSSALNCHLKRHEIGNAAEMMQPVLDMQSHNNVVPESNMFQKTDLDITPRHAQPIPVINYLKSDSQNTQKQTSERNEAHQRLAAGESPKSAIVDKIQSLNLSTVSPPVKLSPTPERSKVISPSLPSVLVMNGSECLDFRTAEKRILDTQDQRTKSLMPTNRPNQVCRVQMAEKVKTDAEPSQSLPLKSVKESVLSAQAAEPHRGKHRDIHISDPSQEAAQEAQDLRISRTTGSIQAEDLSMPTILARERGLSQQTAYQYSTNKIRSTEDVMLIVPKEEPLSPVPSPTCSVIQTTQKGLPQRHLQSPSHSPRPLNLQLRAHLETNQAQQGMHCVEKQRPVPSTCSDHSSELLSSRSALHPQVPHSEPETKNSTSSRDPFRESGYPVQECALPLIMPGGYCSGKKQEDQMLMSYPPAPLSFSALGKMVPHPDATKLPFYPDPYQLLYGPQLLPYPYNITTLPMALNMMAPGDKIEPLPFLPTLFNYAAVGAPLPHHLIVNPSLYNSSSSTKRNSDNP